MYRKETNHSIRRLVYKQTILQPEKNEPHSVIKANMITTSRYLIQIVDRSGQH